ncbi:RHS repeat-associated core domain-containing protein [Streptomyces salinarius]|uniref:RHS repeat-associated core domain-containing protein n=1 Tax=Streptomyces salinarius TaxID=2762598 RepID=A0ABW8BBB2_9ACTN
MPGLEAWATRLRPVSPRCTRIHQSRSTTTEAPQPFRCAGAYADPIGLYKMGHRYYDPTLGRFTQPDPSATKPTHTSTPTATPSRTGPDGAVQLT